MLAGNVFSALRDEPFDTGSSMVIPGIFGLQFLPILLLKYCSKPNNSGVISAYARLGKQRLTENAVLSRSGSKCLLKKSIGCF